MSRADQFNFLRGSTRPRTPPPPFGASGGSSPPAMHFPFSFFKKDKSGTTVWIFFK